MQETKGHDCILLWDNLNHEVTEEHLFSTVNGIVAICLLVIKGCAVTDMCTCKICAIMHF